MITILKDEYKDYILVYKSYRLYNQYNLKNSNQNKK